MMHCFFVVTSCSLSICRWVSWWICCATGVRDGEDPHNCQASRALGFHCVWIHVVWFAVVVRCLICWIVVVVGLMQYDPGILMS